MFRSCGKGIFPCSQLTALPVFVDGPSGKGELVLSEHLIPVHPNPGGDVIRLDPVRIAVVVLINLIAGVLLSRNHDIHTLRPRGSGYGVVVGIMTPETGGDLYHRFCGRPFGDDVDHARNRARSVERGARALDHLDPLDVRGGNLLQSIHARQPGIDGLPVNQHLHVAGLQALHPHDAEVAVRTLLLDPYARHAFQRFVKVHRALGLDVCTRDDLRAHRNIDQQLLRLGSRDHHFLQLEQQLVLLLFLLSQTPLRQADDHACQ